jgi:hypothetical protein
MRARGKISSDGPITWTPPSPKPKDKDTDFIKKEEFKV